MAKPKKKRARPAAPKGPPTNLRPAGAHAGMQELPRAHTKRKAIEEQLDDTERTRDEQG